MRLKAILAAMAILALWWFLYWHQAAYQEPIKCPKLTPEQSRKIEKARRYHGDYRIEGNKLTGQIYMVRDGKRIRII